jgi:hypothetical protein
MDDRELLTETEQQLLMAAAAEGLGPDTDLTRANTARVINQVLRWRGRSPEEACHAWREQHNDPMHEEVYAVLIRMLHQIHSVDPGQTPKRVGEVLFEGSGNWGVPGEPSWPPCEPEFNSCRLTHAGERLARELLERHPEYRKSVMAGDGTRKRKRGRAG